MSKTSLPVHKAPDSIWLQLKTELVTLNPKLSIIHQFYNAIHSGKYEYYWFHTDFTYSGPMADINSIDRFISFYSELSSGVDKIKITDILLGVNKACIQFEIINGNTKLLYSDWVEFSENKISAIRSYFDASSLSNNMTA